MQVFERLLSLSSLECKEAPLVRQKVSLPIFSRGIGFISIETIAPMAYFESWMLITLVITFKLLDLHPLLLKVIGVKFRFIPLLSALEVILGTYFLGCNNIFTFVRTTCRKQSKSTSRVYFRKIAQPFLF
jgi:hypothetical protein